MVVPRRGTGGPEPVEGLVVKSSRVVLAKAQGALGVLGGEWGHPSNR